MTISDITNKQMILEIFQRFLVNDKLGSIYFIFLIVAAGVLTAIAPLLFSFSVDSLAAGDPTGVLTTGLLGYCLVYAMGRAASKTTSYVAAIRAEKLKFVVSTSFFRRVLRKDVSFLARYNAAEIQGAQMAGQQGFNIIYQLVGTVFLPGILEVVVSLWLMGALIDVRLALITATYGGVVIWLTHIANIKTQPWLHAAIGATQQNAQFIGNVVAALEPLKFYRGFQWAEKRFDENAAEVQQSWTAYGRKRIFFSLILAGGLAFQLTINFLLIIPQFQAGAMTIGDVVLFNALLLQLNVPFELIGQSMEQALRAKGDLKPFGEIWSFKEDQFHGNVLPPSRAEMSIRFDDVTYKYSGGNGVANLTFHAPATGLTFIVGSTGSGKSTIFRLLMRQLSPQSGRVLLGDMPIYEIDSDSYFGRVALVPQDIVILNDTVAENISFGREGGPEAVKRAARLAEIHNHIEALPQGYQTRMGERGATFSGGERQRIALARALFASPSLLLLDEASSALDSNTESKIFATIRGISNNIPVISITHRRELIKDFDNIIDLDQINSENNYNIA